MRKYKAWDKEIKLMNDVTVIDFENKEVYYKHWRYGHSEAVSFEDVEFLESTGLFDKNGVEIYDKYIVRDSYGDVFLIEWLESCFILTESYGDYDHSFLDDLSFYEVVGNQFEHPHLLGED